MMGQKLKEWVSCKRKKKYNTEQDTATELKRIKQMIESWLRPTLMAYKCNFCDGWHIGKDRTERKKAESLRDIKAGMGIIKEKLTAKERKILGRYIGYLISQKRVKE
ncbi:hypothetical protein LCGC14_1739620 [marine sediment metagenome]|uniref:Uncharacterized protein n=1 Tax=marine sediment metagenome TaxID=412755 RepID=A0A0F9K6T3_9ZZZZ